MSDVTATREQAEAYLRREDSAILRGMLRAGTPLTREAYIFLNWDKRPEPWTAEHEEQVPDIFQRQPPDVDPSPPVMPTREPSNLSAIRTSAGRPVSSGRLVSPHTNESLRAAGFRVLEPTGRSFVLPMGRPSKR
jgi:hypothetical protein